MLRSLADSGRPIGSFNRDPAGSAPEAARLRIAAASNALPAGSRLNDFAKSRKAFWLGTNRCLSFASRFPIQLRAALRPLRWIHTVSASVSCSVRDGSRPFRRIAAAAAFVVLTTFLSGCGLFSGAGDQFVISRRTQELIPPAREAVAKSLEENFGDGRNLVAWLRFPVNYGDDGRVLKSGWGLYREYCVQCHGGSGGGDGPMAQSLNPRPRDFRLGIFKFTSTAHQEKASREDLKRTVKRGIPGTAMPSFARMDDEQIETTVEYVRWLAIRGEFEKKLVDELATDYSAKAVEERKQMGETDRQIQDELAWFLEDELAGMVESAAADLTAAWTRADQKASLVLPVVSREDTIRGIASDVVDWIQAHGKSLRHGRLESLAKQQKPTGADRSSPTGSVTARLQLDSDADGGGLAGQQLLWITGKLKGYRYKLLASKALAPMEFLLEPLQDAPPLDARETPLKGSRFVVFKEIPGRVAYVVRHGVDMDELLKTAALDPEKLRNQLILDSPRRGRSLFLTAKARCAECHGPEGHGDGELTREFSKIPGTNDNYPTPGLYDSWDHKVKPQDLARGIYRGGGEPIDVYRRIYVGIKGTPMPAFGETALSEDEIWDIVNYVLTVPDEDTSRPATTE